MGGGQETGGSTKELLNFIYLQSKGQMIKKNSWVLYFAADDNKALVKCFSEKFQFSVFTKGH